MTPTAKQQEILALADQLAAEFAPRAAEHDRDNTFPYENFDRLRETRYLALTIPEPFGGLGADLLTFCLAQERLARGCGATALGVNMHLFGLGALAERGTFTDEEGERFFRPLAGGVIVGGGFSEPESGSNWGRPATTARRVEGGYVLNGRKSFNSLAPIIGLFLVTAAIEDPSEPEPRVGFFAVLRGTPGLEIDETWDALGMRATASHDLRLTDVRVSKQQLFHTGPLGELVRAFSNMGVWFQLSIAAVYTGVAEAAYRFALDYARGRQLQGLPRPIAHFPGTQFAAAEMAIELEAARAFVHSVARQWVEGDRTADTGWQARAAAAKLFATEAAVRVVDLAVEVVGGVGLLKRYPLERYYRDVRAGRVHPLSRPVALELIGKHVLGVPPDFEPRWG